MTNRIYEKRSYAVIIAAIVSSLVLILGGTITGLICAVQKRHEANAPDNSRLMAEYLLSDAAAGLKSTMSALRLCTDAEPVETLKSTALVHAVRAETALECHVDEWYENRNKEAFLNDMAVVLHSYTPEQTIELADTLYEFASMFQASVADGSDFEYNGEIMGGGATDEDEQKEITDEDKQAASELVKTALNVSAAEFVGAYGGHIEFFIERDGKTGYAVVCEDKIIEYSFMRDGEAQTDIDSAKTVALEAAKACGYDGLKIKWAEQTGKSVSVLMCREYDGALACDDYATAVVFGDEVVAFSAGGCGNEHHDIPSVKKTEAEARKATRDGGEGVLVVRKKGDKERICYEYRYELDDGVHYVYVCAESGKQIEVK
ncbi:MAG: hypothetical protein HDT28_00190 [Clostridiales bacterium]|nr:hypothetical protein [Clostridiales bacterium]